MRAPPIGLPSRGSVRFEAGSVTVLAWAENRGAQTIGSYLQTQKLVAAKLSDFLDYAGNDRAMFSVTDLNFLIQVLN